MDRLAGKVALVTGAATGMGEQTARLFAGQGARVLLTDIDDTRGAAVATSIGSAAAFARHDVGSASDWERAIAAAIAAFGGIDILVNNAGVGLRGSVTESDEAAFDRIVNVNQRGVFLGTKLAASALSRSGRGAIVNIASGLGLTGAPNMFLYVMSKFAVRGMTRAAAYDLAPHGIRVNAVLPGPIDTEMVRSVPIEGFADMMTATTILKRIGKPIDVAQGVLFLASDEAAYLTGSDMVIDGGATA